MAAPAMDTNDSFGSPVPPKHETLPAREGLPPAPDMQLQILEQLRTLVLLQHQSVTKPPPIVTEFVWNTLLQVLGLAAAALFGAFSILAWQIGQAANELASGANDLASRSNNLGSDGVGLASRANCLEAASNWLSLVAYCQNGGDTRVCNRLNSDYSDHIVGLYGINLQQATSCAIAIRSNPTTTASPTPSPTSPGNSSSPSSSPNVGGIIAGAVLIGIFALAVLYLPFATYRTKRRRSKEATLNKGHFGASGEDRQDSEVVF